MSLLDSGSLVGKKNATTTVDLSSRKPIDNQVSAYDFLFKKNKAALEPRTELVLGTPVRKSRGVGGSVCVCGGGGGGRETSDNVQRVERCTAILRTMRSEERVRANLATVADESNPRALSWAEEVWWQ